MEGIFIVKNGIDTELGGLPEGLFPVELPTDTQKGVTEDTSRQENEMVTSDQTGQHIPISEEDMDKKTNKQLQDELCKRGCKVAGKKAELLARLRNALEDQIPVGQQKSTKAQASTNNASRELSAAFPGTAYWKVLVANEECVTEPENITFRKPRAPTIREEDGASVPVKFNFNDTFDRPAFTGKYWAEQRHKNGKLKKRMDIQ